MNVINRGNKIKVTAKTTIWEAWMNLL